MRLKTNKISSNKLTAIKERLNTPRIRFYFTVIVLVGVSILTKILVSILTEKAMFSFIDTWDLSVYYNTLILPFLQNGSLPYINYTWEYPILMVIPVIIAAAPAVVLHNPNLFLITFPILMIICDAITTICVYLTTNKIYSETRRAYIAAMIYATAFSSAYFVLTKYDAFPTCLLMIAITATLYGTSRSKMGGYLSAILGFFTKIFPVIILPFIALYNAKTTSLKQELITVVKVFLPLGVILAIPVIILNPRSIGTYLIQTASEKEVFADTLLYTIYSWLHGILGVQFEIALLIPVMTGIMVLTIASLLYLAYTTPGRDAEYMLGLILCAIVAVIAFSKYTSPQYTMWITPILCILASGHPGKIFLFYVMQGWWYIKFPMIFWKLYTNQSYTTPLPSLNGRLAVFFFTIEYILLFYLIWRCIKLKPTEGGS